MKLIFRVRYRTVVSESLWLRLTLASGAHGLTQVVPMRWHDDEWWSAELELTDGDALEIDYAYQLRRTDGLVLDEWPMNRRFQLEFAAQESCWCFDAWSSAGTPDRLFETKPFEAWLPPRPLSANAVDTAGANHIFQLHRVALPAACVPCVIGGGPALGDWDWHRAIPMTETSPHHWVAAIQAPVETALEYKYGVFDLRSHCAVGLEIGENRVLPPRDGAGGAVVRVSEGDFRYAEAALFRGAGVAIPVFSLRSEKSYGIGEFADLVPFARWASEVGMKMVQILPIHDTIATHGWADSYPYSAISVYALHPAYLRLDDLEMAENSAVFIELNASREALNASSALDYPAVLAAKLRLTRAHFEATFEERIASARYRDFLAANRAWVVPYAAFCVLRDRYQTVDFRRWRTWARYSEERVNAMALPEHSDYRQLAYYIWLQAELDAQLSEAVERMAAMGVVLKGDLAIGVNRQSVDVWTSPELFHLDAQAGAPPDAFAANGQNWGFPTYRWETMAEDGFAWWKARFARLAKYFAAYRIDHILGFFRIWQIPRDQVQGIMGWFDPAVPISLDELHDREIPFAYERFCQPFLTREVLEKIFGDELVEALAHYLEPIGGERFRLRAFCANQALIVDRFADWDVADPASRVRRDRLRDGLMQCASEVLLHELPGSGGRCFHPRFGMDQTASFQALDSEVQARLFELYHDYFYRRQEPYWQRQALAKLPAMRAASTMLLCGEDLGMVPACVAGVLRELGILSLEIQRMPKVLSDEFTDPLSAAYSSVVSPSTHDMASLRGWWLEDPNRTARFAWKQARQSFPPADLSPEWAETIIRDHLRSPAMWAIFSLQDLLGIDEDLRSQDIEFERINVPADPHHQWKYRMHITIEHLTKADGFTEHLRSLLADAGRLTLE